MLTEVMLLGKLASTTAQMYHTDDAQASVCPQPTYKTHLDAEA